MKPSSLKGETNTSTVINSQTNSFTHGSLFSGIGGFDLAAEWMGWENLFHCEWNPFGQKVLNHYWPRAESFTDITKTDFTPYANRIDVLTGGFPCQPYSTAGKRLGKEDERHLWPEMLRAIREISPRWVVGENVRGLISWNGGVVFDEVQADLEAAGYEVFPVLLPAAGINAPHERYRIWFVAHASGPGRTFGISARIGSLHESPTALKRGESSRIHSTPGWDEFPTQSPICIGNDGLPAGLDLAPISFAKWRAESVKAGGNAIVPKVALQIFRAIAQTLA